MVALLGWLTILGIWTRVMRWILRYFWSLLMWRRHQFFSNLICAANQHCLFDKSVKFIAFQTSSRFDEIEILAVKELHSKISSLISSEVQPSDSSLLNACKDELQPLIF